MPASLPLVFSPISSRLSMKGSDDQPGAAWRAKTSRFVTVCEVIKVRSCVLKSWPEITRLYAHNWKCFHETRWEMGNCIQTSAKPLFKFFHSCLDRESSGNEFPHQRICSTAAYEKWVRWVRLQKSKNSWNVIRWKRSCKSNKRLQAGLRNLLTEKWKDAN